MADVPRPKRIPAPRPARPPMPPPRGRRPDRAAPGLRIIHEDADLIIVDKPPGLLTSNIAGEMRDSAFDFVKRHMRRRKRAARAWIIHRLDKEASGLLVFAKSEKAFEWLKEDFKSRRVHRLYAAVIEGEMVPAGSEPGETGGEFEKDTSVPSQSRGTIQSLLLETRTGKVRSIPPDQFRGPLDQPGKRARPGPGNTARPAVTHYRVLSAGKGRSLLQVRPQTGRKHQIRVHLSESGHPIIGDAMYGATTDPIGRLALHATDLGFTHPSTGQTVRFHSPAPASFHHAVGMKPPAPPKAPPPAPAPAARRPGAESPGRLTTSWDHIAGWYDDLMEGRGESRADHFERVILPGTLRLLAPEPGLRVLDIACGEGALCRAMSALGLRATGVDASERLIESARAKQDSGKAGSARFLVGDARDLGRAAQNAGAAAFGSFDAAVCTMALMNIDPMEPVLRGCARLLAPGGRIVVVILHPAFRAPGQTSWGRDERPDAGREGRRTGEGGIQYRRVDGYLSPGQTEIVMNPGQAAHGKRPITTWTFHRPIQSYIRALAEAGFLVEALEEWPSLRRSEPGPRADEENRARREIPMFLGIRAVKRPSSPSSEAPAATNPTSPAAP